MRADLWTERDSDLLRRVVTENPTITRSQQRELFNQQAQLTRTQKAINDHLSIMGLTSQFKPKPSSRTP